MHKFIWMLCASMLCAVCHASVNTNILAEENFKQLEKAHQAFSKQFYASLTRTQQSKLNKIPRIQQLSQRVKELRQAKQKVLAIGLIHHNLEIIKKQFDNRALFELISVLLSDNQWYTANDLFSVVKNDGDITLVANISYLFAKYYFARQDWSAVMTNLDNNFNELPFEELNHAYLMYGIALQNQKKHRLALPYYEKVAENSKHYISARLNMAVAYIRQDWWTDAHIVINDLLQNPQFNKKEETVNRLYLVLGYSFLNQNYYRNSRNAFRNINIESRYTNRALMGIVLTAAEQEDYIGALNALNILNRKKLHDLPVDESHLLLPYIYEKLLQHTTASAGYADAVSYYENRIIEFETLLKRELDLRRISLDINEKHRFMLDNNIIDVKYNFPQSFIDNHLRLDSYETYLNDINDSRLTAQFQALRAKSTAVLKEIVTAQIKIRIAELNSYMNQARFGVARLYDNSIKK